MAKGEKKSQRTVDRRHHKAERLPPSILSQLHERLKRGETYEHVEAWLESIGHQVGKSSLHRYHRYMREGLERQRERAVLAEKIVAANAGRDPSVVQNAAYQVAMQQALEYLVDLEIGESEMSVTQLSKLMTALARMGGTSTQLADFLERQRAKLAEADRQVDKLTARKILSAEQAAEIKRMYGIE